MKELEEKRTKPQNNALHKWCRLKAEQCRDAGVSPKMAFSRTIELEMTPEIMKEIWRQTQAGLFNKRSTTQLNKKEEIDEVVEHLNRFFAQEFYLEGIEFPHNPQKKALTNDLEM